MNDDIKLRTSRALLKAFGMEPTPELLEQLGVFVEALLVYDDRERTYGGQWRNSGAIDNLRNARRKISRQIAVVSSVCETSPPTLSAGNLDDGTDALNYIAFFMRNARLINFDGEQDDDFCHNCGGEGCRYCDARKL